MNALEGVAVNLGVLAISGASAVAIGHLLLRTVLRVARPS